MASRLIRTGSAGALTVALVVLPLNALPAYAAETHTLQLLNINDFHGRISQDIGMGLANTIQQQRVEDPNTLLLSAGDNVSASLYVSSVQNDQPTIDYLNALGLQASATGNHEYDKGLDDLTGRLTDAADFPYLAANVTDKATGEPVSLPYVVLDAPDGTRVAVIGTVSQETPTLTDPSALASVNFTDPVAATNKYAQMLSDGDESNGEADVIVAEYHEGINSASPDTDSIVTNTSAAVDVIFTGHTHEEYVVDGAVPGEPGKTRPVLQTGNYGDNLGDVTLTLDENNEVVSYTSTLHKRAEAPTADQVAADPVLAQVEQILTSADAYATEQGSVEVATLGGKITTGWDATKQDSKGGFDQRNLESTMGHLVADMYLSAANSTGRTPADIGIVNPGGLRDEFPAGLRTSLATEAGVLKVSDVVSVAPFANNLWTTELTGAQLKQVLEEQWQANEDGTMSTRPYLQLGFSSNLTYTYSGSTDADGFADRGNHIQQIYVNGEPVEDTDTFTVAIPSFLLSGGDNFRTLAEGTNAKDTALVDSDAFITYLKGLGTVSPRYEKQAVRVENLQESYDLAGNLTFDLSDLNTRSYDVPALTSMKVSVDGVDLGTVDVVDGSASVDLPLSVDAKVAAAGITPGQHEIVLTDATGVVETEIRLAAEFMGETTAEPTVEPTAPVETSAPTAETSESGTPVGSTEPTDSAAPAAPAVSAEPSAEQTDDKAVVVPADTSGTDPVAVEPDDSRRVTSAPQTFLANTGFSGVQLAVGAGVVVLLGVALVALARRNRS